MLAALFFFLKAAEVNMRLAPQIDATILYTYNKPNLPFKELTLSDRNTRYKDWIYVQDYEKERGWIHKSLLYQPKKGIYFILLLKPTFLYNAPNIHANKIAELSKYVIAEVISNQDKDWMQVRVNQYKGKTKISQYKGWIPNTSSWWGPHHLTNKPAKSTQKLSHKAKGIVVPLASKVSSKETILPTKAAKTNSNKNLADKEKR